MAYRVFVTPSAVADLEDYREFISQSSRTRSQKWLTEAWTQILALADMPTRFAVISESEELGEELRDVMHYSHRIVYRVLESAKRVEVVRVWHSARDELQQGDVT